MKFVLLPDYDSDTKEGMHELAFSLRGSASSVLVHHYDHWKNKLESGFPEIELKHVILSATPARDVIFVSEGRGAEVVLRAIEKHSINPFACIFIDAPLKISRQTKKTLAASRTKSLFLNRSAKTTQAIRTFLDSIGER